MIINWDEESPAGPGFSAQPEVYDAFPLVRSLRVGAMPTVLSPDREAIAAHLAFGDWISGRLVLPRPVSPTTAEAVEADSFPARVRVHEIDYTPRALPMGKQQVHVRFDDEPVSESGFVIRVLDSLRHKGLWHSCESLRISSNAFALEKAGASGKLSLRARLAVAVLFAEDLEADELILAQEACSADELQALQSLLAAVNLGIIAK